VALVDHDEKAFHDALKTWLQSSNPDEISQPLNLATSLRDKADDLLRQTPSSSAMRIAIGKYTKAIDQWRQAMASIRESGKITVEVQELMERGQPLAPRSG
jgi:hypothetical protein